MGVLVFSSLSMHPTDLDSDLCVDLLASWQTCLVTMGLSGNLWSVSDHDLWIDHQAWLQTYVITMNLPDVGGLWLKLPHSPGQLLWDWP